jgi:hypothetical protein
MEKNNKNKLPATFNLVYKSPINKSISRYVRNFGSYSERFTLTCEEKEKLMIPDASK